MMAAIPDLYQHLLVHQQEASLKGQDFSLLDFLHKHFLDTDSHNDERHDNLPLKSVHSAIHFCLKKVSPSLLIPETLVSIILFFQLELISLDLTKNLFRPPIF